MSWFRVDDGFWSNPKTRRLPPGAVALWVRAGSYCCQHLTDGFVDEHDLPMLQGKPADVDALVEQGIWRPVEGGWTFHDWHDYQETKETILARREAYRTRQRRFREKRGSGDDLTTNDESESHSSYTHPIPSGDTRDSRVTSRVTQRVTPTPIPPPFTPEPVALGDSKRGVAKARAALKSRSQEAS